MTARRVRHRRSAALAAVLLGALLATAACSPDVPAQAGPSAEGTGADAGGRGGGASPTAVLALAGDVHFEGASASLTDLGSAFDVLAGADLAVVNLETAVTTGGTKVDKQYAFRAPPAAMTALHDAGVDAVTLANNHGMDYGASGLRDTLAAGREADLPVLGAGRDVDDAFAPLRAEPNGVPVSVIAATDVLDSSVETAWTASATRPGLASAKDAERLLDDVRSEAEAGRVVVVFLHWGTERVQCPTGRQTRLAAALAEAGAAVVVGSHAHVLQPTAEVDGALVAHGLGNFHFYARGGLGSQTGVLTVEVDRDGVVGSTWHPATIRSGRPDLLDDAEQRTADRGPDELSELAGACAAGGTPSPPQSTVQDDGDGPGSASPTATEAQTDPATTTTAPSAEPSEGEPPATEGPTTPAVPPSTGTPTPSVAPAG